MYYSIMIHIYYKRNYIAFNLYINSLTRIFTNNHIEYKVITNIKDAIDYDYLILFVNDATDVMHIKDKVIFIVADYFILHSKDFQEKFTHYVKVINPDNIYVWEYNVLNIEYYKIHLPNIKMTFIPLLYNKYLEEVYNVPRIEYKDKPIDVLFMGCVSERRVELLKKIQGRYKFYFMTNVNDMNRYMNIIENSKIIIHIFSNDFNRTFDYYRFSMLLANKVMILTEDYIEDETDVPLIICNYDNFVEKIQELLQKPPEEISEIVEKSYNEFKKYDMEKYVLDFFKPLYKPLEKPLQLFKVFMSEDVLEPLNKTLMSGFISQGEQVNLFEKKLTDFFGNENLLTLNSATSGLTLALRLLLKPSENWPGIDKDDYVLSPALTCFATNVAILANHCKIKWLDTDNTTANVSIEDIKRKLSKKTKVLYLVHWGGYPVDLDALKELQEEHLVKYGYKFMIVEDCAHAFGAEYKNKKLGNHGNICVFSFQAIKHLTTGDGGLIVLPNHLYERAKLLRWFGIDRDKRNYKKDFRLENDISEWGYKFHMNDLNAVIGLYNLPHINGLLEKNRENHDYLYKNLKGVELLENNPDRKSACWLFTIKVNNKTDFIEKMKDKGIMTSQVHNRNDLHSCVSEFSCDLPNITELEKSLVCIPSGWWLEKRELDYIIVSIHEILNNK